MSAARRAQPPRRGRTARRGGQRLRRAARGDRPYVVALVALVVLIGAMALGPLQNYTAAADRVENLERTRDQLRAEVDTLEQRRERLTDPEELETMARSLGLVKPGEIPFVVVPPDEAQPQIGPEPPAGEDDGDVAWYRRLGRWLRGLVGTAGG